MQRIKNRIAMKWLHNLLKGLSLTAVLFVVQACYGTPPGYPEDYDFPEEAVIQPTAETPEAAATEAGTPETEDPEAVKAE